MGYDCSCDYEPPSFYSKRRVRAARKQFSCGECGAAIKPGTPYERISGMWDGYFDSFVTCPHCVSLKEWAIISVPCFCWAHGNLLQDVREMVDEVRHDVPGFFFEYGRRVVAAKRAKAAERSLP